METDSKHKTGAHSSRWIDISVSVHTGMVHWPSDPAIRIEHVLDLERGDSHTVSEITMGSHTGTHIDAPLHFLTGSNGIDQIPFDAVIGKARVLEINDTESIKPAELAEHKIRRGERILFKTRNSDRVWRTDRFVEDFVFLSNEAADYLAACRVKALGMDYLSVGGFKHGGGYAHRTLLAAGVWIIEGLDLSRIKSGKYDLICLPLKVTDGDGAPARAVIKPVTSSSA